MQNHTRLDDLLARDAGPLWFEGVAVVQLTCRQLREQGATGFPRAADILIGPGGSITITGEATGNPVEAAAHVLALMLSDDVPVRLRLAVSQATATGSGYASLAEFSEALAYFERPGPEAIVDGFRQRALVAGRREVTAPTRIEALPVPKEESVRKSAAPPRRTSRLAVIAATVAGLACASVWVIGGAVPRLAGPEAASAERQEPAAEAEPPRAKRVATSGASAPRKLVGHSSSTPVASSSSAARGKAREPIADLRVDSERVTYRYSPLSLLPLDARATGPGQPSFTISVSGPVAGAPTDESPDRIYSPADPEVALPVNIYPRFPTEPAAAIGLSGRTILELTIAADGLVERVKMLTAPRNIHEFMLLSAAKAWRFEPATIGGRPVRFRHTMALIPMP